ncbi:MAG: chorismate mutase [Candidatus Dormibacteraceae bacterium]
MRGIRGATTALANSSEAISEATAELLTALVSANQLQPEEVAAIFFTTTPDLDAEYPALAARRLGWHSTPLMCGNDMAVPGPNARSIPMCIRILLLYNTDRPQTDMKSAYLRGAQAIRADLDATRRESQDQ